VQSDAKKFIVGVFPSSLSWKSFGEKFNFSFQFSCCVMRAPFNVQKSRAENFSPTPFVEIFSLTGIFSLYCEKLYFIVKSGGGKEVENYFQ
jgi:hypothetical protein